MCIKLDTTSLTIGESFRQHQLHFLLRILYKHGFGDKWISWIKWCVTSSHLSVLVNGGSTERFKPSKGLRQDDSLSPYVFLVVVEILGKLMNDVVQRGQITGFKVTETGSMISHLQFADDTLIFIDANADEKSTMISVGADEVIGELAKELGCKTEVLPIKYLGMPIGATSSIWDTVLEKMAQKMGSEDRHFCVKVLQLDLTQRRKE
ncbi:uncharacterized protein LOC113291730 [Papaver somniferum]|uniref:uncharacterized protein LOC113291730 n=1 Tax=Papaver somniferum TaxID=3469 RepID=UPI000E6FD69E|nr:uncharacterized protein LOC113291730 [Papaver somniferum]